MAELRHLGSLLRAPASPFLAVLGGAKVSDKIDLVLNLLPRVDGFLIGGAMAYTFLRAEGVGVGRALVEEDKIGLAKDLLARARAAIHVCPIYASSVDEALAIFEQLAR